MISPKKIIKMAKKWQKLAASKRKRISFRRNTTASVDAECCSTTSMDEKGHFVVHTADVRRFVVLLNYLKNKIIIKLFRIAEEEVRLQSSGPMTLPCDSIFMEYVVSLIQRHAAKDVEKALLMSLTTSRCDFFLPSGSKEQCNKQSVIYSFRSENLSLI